MRQTQLIEAVHNDILHHDHHQRRSNTIWLELMKPILALIGLGIFVKSFFLAKHALPQTSTCSKSSAADLLMTQLHLSNSDIAKLQQRGILTTDNNGKDDGCWIPRLVDALAFIVVDALRFDFALHHLPKSIGARIGRLDNSAIGSGSSKSRTKASRTTTRSQLFKFVADPPTVTTQRLKALTTGTLPTFADISTSFGGATVEEDSWVNQLMTNGKKIGFVGDDTWVDLFPTQLAFARPYPSFNTRDLNTVDNGCLVHIPKLLKSFGPASKASETKRINKVHSTMSSMQDKKDQANTMTNNNDDDHDERFDVIVVHFLGVDHVGHTFGPNTKHMNDKLSQMDDVLSMILDNIDDKGNDSSCNVAFILGDHGMTEDGNHGGGTAGEVNAALFAHYSSGCDSMATSFEDGPTYEELSFNSVSQIDLVPTLSFLLGIPVPFASIGGLIPSLLPSWHIKSTPGKSADLVENDHDGSSAAGVTAALALNAAQVWNYLTTYSREADALPSQSMHKLLQLLQSASFQYKEALEHDGVYEARTVLYLEAGKLYKTFLTEAAVLGRLVWTRFDIVGMAVGVLIVGIVAVWEIGCIMAEEGKTCSGSELSASNGDTSELSLNRSTCWFSPEVCVTSIFMAFQCLALPFSNSYVMAERQIIMFFISVLCIVLGFRLFILGITWDTPKTNVVSELRKAHTHNKEHISATAARGALLLVLCALCSRANELLVSGHGTDPSLKAHTAHQPLIFLSTILILCAIVTLVNQIGRRDQWKFTIDLVCDYVALFFLGLNWWEKRTSDSRRNGYFFCHATMTTALIGFIVRCFLMRQKAGRQVKKFSTGSGMSEVDKFKLLSPIVILIMTVTGPSSGASALLVCTQFWSIFQISRLRGLLEISPTALAGLWRLVIRHAFFSSGHSCAFNRLQYSAAFVAGDVFRFYFAGACLFLNTFGWDIVGHFLVATAFWKTSQGSIWRRFCLYSILEGLGSSISVSVVRRHLMVWDIFAPRFAFSAMFVVITMIFWVITLVLPSFLVYSTFRYNKG